MTPNSLGIEIELDEYFLYTDVSNINYFNRLVGYHRLEIRILELPSWVEQVLCEFVQKHRNVIRGMDNSNHQNRLFISDKNSNLMENLKAKFSNHSIRSS